MYWKLCVNPKASRTCSRLTLLVWNCRRKVTFRNVDMREKIRPEYVIRRRKRENICEDWESQLKLDVPKSDLFLWISISSSASLEYFREVRRILMSSSNTTLDLTALLLSILTRLQQKILRGTWRHWMAEIQIDGAFLSSLSWKESETVDFCRRCTWGKKCLYNTTWIHTDNFN